MEPILALFTPLLSNNSYSNFPLPLKADVTRLISFVWQNKSTRGQRYHTPCGEREGQSPSHLHTFTSPFYSINVPTKKTTPKPLAPLLNNNIHLKLSPSHILCLAKQRNTGVKGYHTPCGEREGQSPSHLHTFTSPFYSINVPTKKTKSPCSPEQGDFSIDCLPSKALPGVSA